ncbi:hypothetical protein CALVIDRAFT_537351 [Calocera viscosa TUFC12733]|uniref:Uncharacterized protein n=1 Tax=Calocera viscosa (strain TUFC12733) TaxID=1330018 RepID=A0A167LY46_CALVF|nr:hypothetical protein CALVIDRAFT_537351 [Calocera viscosa TUFC12733]
MTDAMTRRTAQITALRPELEAHFVQIEKMNRGEVDSETARRIRKEAKEFLQRMDRLAEIPSHYPRIRSASDFILPFPLPGTDNWSFLRGHYIIYARGTQKPGEHWGTMRTLFLTEGWDAVQALIRQGREVGAVLDSNMLPKKDGPKTVGLEQLPALAGREAEKKLDPNYMAIISLEHVPHVIFDSVCGSVQRISSRLTSFLQRYRESFASGQQWRTAGALWQTALDPVDGPLGTLKRVGEALDNRRKERQREEQAVREKEKRGGAAP